MCFVQNKRDKRANGEPAFRKAPVVPWPVISLSISSLKPVIEAAGLDGAGNAPARRAAAISRPGRPDGPPLQLLLPGQAGVPRLCRVGLHEHDR
mmetsp:Transcript_51624/g.107843  ORF Transcript_51624/g.107843 Transcript_51624/m.107843 type:complete len:94 (+) Transcript_51624:192-473(+)